MTETEKLWLISTEPCSLNELRRKCQERYGMSVEEFLRDSDTRPKDGDAKQGSTRE